MVQSASLVRGWVRFSRRRAFEESKQERAGLFAFWANRADSVGDTRFASWPNTFARSVANSYLLWQSAPATWNVPLSALCTILSNESASESAKVAVARWSVTMLTCPS